MDLDNQPESFPTKGRARGRSRPDLSPDTMIAQLQLYHDEIRSAQIEKTTAMGLERFFRWTKEEATHATANVQGQELSKLKNNGSQAMNAHRTHDSAAAADKKKSPRPKKGPQPRDRYKGCRAVAVPLILFLEGQERQMQLHVATYIATQFANGASVEEVARHFKKAKHKGGDSN